MTEERTEGWGVIRPGDRRAHYYRDTMSLCRRVGFYRGPLEPDTNPSPDDHAECRKVLDREARICTAAVEALVKRDGERDPAVFRGELALAIQHEGGTSAILAAARDIAKAQSRPLQSAIGVVLIERYNRGHWRVKA